MNLLDAHQIRIIQTNFLDKLVKSLCTAESPFTTSRIYATIVITAKIIITTITINNSTIFSNPVCFATVSYLNSTTRSPLTYRPKTDTIIRLLKSGIHPTNYRRSYSAMWLGLIFNAKHCANGKRLIKWERRRRYPLVKVHISSDLTVLYR